MTHHQETVVASPPVIHKEFPSVPARNRWLDGTIDSEGRLPTVTFAPNPEGDSGDWPGYLDILHNDETGSQRVVGHVALLQDVMPSEPAMQVISHIKIDEGYQGSGYGMATYLKIMKELPLGAGLQSDEELSPGSYGLWRRLEALGVAMSDKTHEAVLEADGPNLDVIDSVEFRTVFGPKPTQAEVAVNGLHTATQDRLSRENPRNQ